MQADLDRERKAMTRLRAKRETQLRAVLKATAGMYGDLQGLAGTALEEIEPPTTSSAQHNSAARRVSADQRPS
jgi:hypothetical protein